MIPDNDGGDDEWRWAHSGDWYWKVFLTRALDAYDPDRVKAPRPAYIACYRLAYLLYKLGVDAHGVA